MRVSCHSAMLNATNSRGSHTCDAIAATLKEMFEKWQSGRQVVGHFKHSPLAYSRLQDIHLEMNMQPKRLQQDVKTRWNSTYFMIESLIEQKRALSAYSAEHELPTTLTANQWALLEKTMTCLEPFEEPFEVQDRSGRKVSSATASTADVVPSVTVLSRLLSMETEADSGIKTMKKTLLGAVDKHFSTVEDEPLYALSTLLDPRYKDTRDCKHITLQV